MSISVLVAPGHWSPKGELILIKGKLIGMDALMKKEKNNYG
jgi:hypothetical protein